MAIVAWLGSLPTDQYLPIAKRQVDQRSIFATDAGGPKVAATTTSAFYEVEFDVVFSGSQVATFWSWYNNQLANGANDFTGHNSVDNDVAVKYRFRAPPSFAMIRTGSTSFRRSRATFQLWEIP